MVIEDAAHAVGATTPDGPVGNCAHSDLTCFSFHPVKPITTGEGGAVTTNDDRLAGALRRFRNHGTERRPKGRLVLHEVTSTGFNYRIPDMQAALGVSQLRKLPGFIAERNRIADRYREKLAPLAIELPPRRRPAPPTATTSSRSGSTIDAACSTGCTPPACGPSLRAAAPCTAVYAPVGPGPAGLPEVDAAYERLISIPIHPSLTDSDQDVVIDALTALVGPR